MRRLLSFIAGLALVGVAPQVHAQDPGMFNAYGGIAPNLAMNQILLQPVRESVAQTMSRGGGGAGGPGSSRYLRAPAPAGAYASGASANVAQAPTTYRASPAVNARVRQQFTDFIRKTSGDQAARVISAELARKDYIREWNNHFAVDGLKPGDAADALAGYWVLNWQIATGTEEANSQGVRAVREMVRNTMASNPEFARLNEAQRQEMAEVMIYNGVVQSNVYGDAAKRGDRAMLRKLGDAAVARFRNEMGVDLREMRLTPAGFQRGG